MFKMPFKLLICLFLAFAMEMEMEQSSAEMERIQVSMEAPQGSDAAVSRPTWALSMVSH